MIFELYGIVKHKGKKIANGVNGRFETKDERVILRLKMLGFKEVVEEKPEEKKKPGRPKTNTKEPK